MSRLAPRTIDKLILAGLRMTRKPVTIAGFWRAYLLPQGLTETERTESLARLVARGLVTRRQVPLHQEHPLFSDVVTVYEAVREPAREEAMSHGN